MVSQLEGLVVRVGGVETPAKLVDVDESVVVQVQDVEKLGKGALVDETGLLRDYAGDPSAELVEVHAVGSLLEEVTQEVLKGDGVEGEHS